MPGKTFALLAAAATALAGAASTQGSAAPAPLAGDAASGVFVGRDRFAETSGEQMYLHVCAACHMPDAKGAEGAGRYPALANNTKLAAGGYPLSVVMQGLNGMPPLGKQMTDQQAADVVNYIRSHFGNRYTDELTAEDIAAMRQ